MATVYRLETGDGGGCFETAYMQDYTDAAVFGGIMSAEENAYTHFHTATRGCPSPFNDEELLHALKDAGLKLGDDGVRFAFPSLDVAREWFPPCMQQVLESNQQTLTVWDVPDEHVAASPRQAVFNRDAATLVERLPVSALYA